MQYAQDRNRVKECITYDLEIIDGIRYAFFKLNRTSCLKYRLIFQKTDVLLMLPTFVIVYMPLIQIPDGTSVFKLFAHWSPVYRLGPSLYSVCGEWRT